MAAPSDLSPNGASPARADRGDPDCYELVGTVERVTYHNPETGFSVLKVKARGHRGPVALVTRAPAVEPGERVLARGSWVHDPRYGLQFKADRVKATLPRTREGIERYLGSGLIEGIGPVHAGRLVEAFGDRVFDIIERQPWKLREVPGIGTFRAERILIAWAQQRTLRELVLFLHEHGLTPDCALRIHQAYGGASLHILRTSPYRLSQDVGGMGFAVADGLARAMGMEADDPIRLSAGLLHMLNRATEEGSCGLTADELLARTGQLLGVEPHRLRPVLDQGLETGAVVAETIREEACVFPGWLHQCEKIVAERLVALCRGAVPWPHVDPLAGLADLACEAGIVLSPGQESALRTALASKVLIMTGGPGVGKTTLIDTIVKLLSRRGVRIALAAPTGRAAKRLSEATGMEARTIHRLLEVDPRGVFRRGRDRPLDVDLLVLDEVSMIDIRLMSAVVAALPLRAGLLMVGDADQLPSVGPGRVLGEAILSGIVPVVQLRDVFRQAAASRIVQAAHRLNAGAMPEPPPAGANSDFYLIEAKTPARSLDVILHLMRERIPERFGLDPLQDIQVLCPMNRGGLGAGDLNRFLQQAINPEASGPCVRRGPWSFAMGDRVMQVENDYERDVYNGDIGRVVAVDVTEQTIDVLFDERLLRYAGADLDKLTLAYACTIHKAQGCEYPAVIVPLTLQHARMLERNLLYTAITRGRKLVVLVGDRRALEYAARNIGARPRRSTLALRLREAADHARSERTTRTATPAMGTSPILNGQQAGSVLTGTSKGA